MGIVSHEKHIQKMINQIQIDEYKKYLKYQREVAPALHHGMRVDNIAVQGMVEAYHVRPKYTQRLRKAIKEKRSINDNWLINNGGKGDHIIEKNKVEYGLDIMTSLCHRPETYDLRSGVSSIPYTTGNPSLYHFRPEVMTISDGQTGYTESYSWWMSDRIHDSVDNSFTLVSIFPQSHGNMTYNRISMGGPNFRKWEQKDLDAATKTHFDSDLSNYICSPIALFAKRTSPSGWVHYGDTGDYTVDDDRLNIDISTGTNDVATVFIYNAWGSSWSAAGAPACRLFSKLDLNDDHSKGTTHELLIAWTIILSST